MYDPKWVADYYDSFAEKEWDRLALSPGREIQFIVHAELLKRFLNSGDRVLEIGAGPGRFTETLHHIGADVLVGDISQVQLDLNARFARERGFGPSVIERRLLDVCDLSVFESGCFDAVVAYGGPLSYVLDRRGQALSEFVRVVRRGGLVIVGVMSLWGTVHQYLEGVLGYGPEENAKIIETGDLTAANSRFASHFCHLFRSSELRTFLESADLEVVAMSASSALSAVHGARLDAIRVDESKWSELVRMEILACQAPGYLDGGTHLIAVGRKR